jgi:hypothetical protein
MESEAGGLGLEFLDLPLPVLMPVEGCSFVRVFHAIAQHKVNRGRPAEPRPTERFKESSNQNKKNQRLHLSLAWLTSASIVPRRSSPSKPDGGGIFFLRQIQTV